MQKPFFDFLFLFHLQGEKNEMNERIKRRVCFYGGEGGGEKKGSTKIWKTNQQRVEKEREIF